MFHGDYGRHGHNFSNEYWSKVLQVLQAPAPAVDAFDTEMYQYGDAAFRERGERPRRAVSVNLPWEVVRSNLVINGHHMGTTRMAKDPAQGVVDANLRVHSLENPYVAGSSVFPSAGVSNPTLTIIALSIRLADHLKGVLGRG
jgi:choline dehydrogenase-like flavoprotein